MLQGSGDVATAAADLDNPPTDANLLSCSRYVQENADLSLLASVLDVSDDEFDQIRHRFKKTQAQALQLMKIWREKKGKSATKRELADVLGSADLGTKVVDR